MDRDEPRDEGAWTFVVVPGGGRGAVREYHLTAGQLRLARYGIIAVVVLLLGLLLTVGTTVPRSLAYGGLLSENLTLKQSLQQVDDQMAEVDRLLLRLRLYDAQLKSLAEPKGDHGPVDWLPMANEKFADIPMAVNPALPQHDRPAERWADAVVGRASAFVSLFDAIEPDLNGRVGELEDLKALAASLPHRWPAKGIVSSGYGWRRHPFLRQWKYHDGVDIANERGTPVRAVARGRILRAEWTNGYGNVVDIDHGYGITTRYGHCQRIYVKAGEYVEEGERIAAMGSTGRSTGPHVHFEVHIDGTTVDPMDYLPRTHGSAP